MDELRSIRNNGSNSISFDFKFVIESVLQEGIIYLGWMATVGFLSFLVYQNKFSFVVVLYNSLLKNAFNLPLHTFQPILISLMGAVGRVNRYYYIENKVKN